MQCKINIKKESASFDTPSFEIMYRNSDPIFREWLGRRDYFLPSSFSFKAAKASISPKVVEAAWF